MFEKADPKPAAGVMHTERAAERKGKGKMGKERIGKESMPLVLIRFAYNYE